MLRIGVTGRMASGKSTVARRFEAKGATRVDGDALGWETLRDAEVKSAISSAFGTDVMDGAGEVDRGRLGTVVFRDHAAMNRLNAIARTEDPDGILTAFFGEYSKKPPWPRGI